MSTARRPLVAGNWKMHKTGAEARAFCVELLQGVAADPAADVAVCPPFTALEATVQAVAGSPVRVLAQNVHESASGAHTSEISAGMIVGTGAHGTLIGHSECRAAGDTDEQVVLRVRAALDAGLMVMLCVGESRALREAGDTESWLSSQVRSALGTVDAAEQDRLVIVYEPIWAVGTGHTATPEIAQAACAHVRTVASERIDADLLRVLYGGSVSPGNAVELMAQPDVDGVLVGGASLGPASFAQIVDAAA